jgi:Tfp pilus assembly protein PilF
VPFPKAIVFATSLPFLPFVAAHAHGDAQGRLRRLAVLLEARPELAEARLERAALLMERADYDRAMHDAEILSAFPDYRERAELLKSRLLATVGQTARASEILAHFLTNHPDHASSLWAQSELLVRQNQPKAALDHLDRHIAHTKAPSPDALLQRLRLSEACESPAAALEWINQRLAKAPLFLLQSEAFRLEMALGKHSEALSRLETLSQTVPLSLEKIWQKTQLLQQLGRKLEAQELLASLVSNLQSLPASQRDLPANIKLLNSAQDHLSKAP